MIETKWHVSILNGINKDNHFNINKYRNEEKNFRKICGKNNKKPNVGTSNKGVGFVVSEVI